MASLPQILPYIQIGLSVVLIVSILLQQSQGGLGGAFGGGDNESTKFTKRGFEKSLFQFTIVVAVLFALSAFAALIIS
jgi:preprotein translocase subunit SecG